MSTRTVIEINHDYLTEMEHDPEHFFDLLKQLRGSAITGKLNKGETPNVGPGLRVLGQRHHSERLKLDAAIAEEREAWSSEIRPYLIAASDSSMSRNNSEQLADELLEWIDGRMRSNVQIDGQPVLGCPTPMQD